MRLYPAGALAYCVMLVGLTFADRAYYLPGRVLLGVSLISLAWGLISAIATIGAPHRSTRLLAGLWTGKTALGIVSIYCRVPFVVYPRLANLARRSLERADDHLCLWRAWPHLPAAHR